jgi:hypothetical protein
MASKRYIPLVTQITHEQSEFLKALAEKAGEPVSVTLRALIDEKRRAALFLTDDVLKYTVHQETEQVVA